MLTNVNKSLNVNKLSKQMSQTTIYSSIYQNVKWQKWQNNGWAKYFVDWIVVPRIESGCTFVNITPNI